MFVKELKKGDVIFQMVSSKIISYSRGHHFLNRQLFDMAT
jgi:hypothetical protein